MRPFPFERWPRFDEVFEQALELEGPGLDAFLDEACGDREMRLEVEALLDAEMKSRRLFGDSGASSWAVPLQEEGPRPDEMCGLTVGAYRILDVIGQGGTATVYRAERADGAFQHSVAVKILDPSLMGREARARFRQERQILAGLEHPNIARMLDGGISEDGWPYIVMELVEGEPIDRFCDARRLSLRERLRLILPVCDAVQHAHRSLIVHRDLKPGNILVAPDGRVKLLDFGIAKLLGDLGLGGDAVETRTGVLTMTPAYAAPEQIQGGTVTTATDVYQLGEVLYLLLTGRRAFEGETEWASMLTRLQRDAPPAPSIKVTRAAGRDSSVYGRPEPGADELAHLRGTTVGRLRRDLSGDLDTLILTALQTDPGRRYHSAGQMAQDVERFLEGRPLVAHPDSVAYRTAKFLRRHPIATVGTLAASMVLLGLSTRLVHEYQRAESESEKAAAVTDFMVGLFQETDPGAAASDTLTAMALLEVGVDRIEHQLADQPVVQAAVQSAVGKAYLGLGRYDEAEALLSSALEARRALLPARHSDLAASLADMGSLHFERAQWDEAERLFREALAVSQVVHGLESRETARILGGLALIQFQRGEVEASLSRYQEALRIYRRVGPVDEEVASLLVNLGWLHNRQERWQDAEAVFREAIQIRRHLLGPDHGSVGTALAALAGLELRAGRPDSAVVHAGEALRITEGVYGSDNFKVSGPLMARGNALIRAGRTRDAEIDYRRARVLVYREVGEASPIAARINNDLGNLARDGGRLGESEDLLRAAVRGYTAALGDGHLFAGIALHNLARTVADRGRTGDAEHMLLRAVGIFEAQGFESSPTLGRSLTLLGRLEVESGRPAVADSILRRALSIWEAADPPDPMQLAITRAHLGRSLHQSSRLGESESLLRDAHAAMREIGTDAHPTTRRVAGWLAELYEDMGRIQEADLYRELSGS